MRVLPSNFERDLLQVRHYDGPTCKRTAPAVPHVAAIPFAVQVVTSEMSKKYANKVTL